MFNQEQRQKMLNLARQAISSRFTKEAIIFPDDEALKVYRGVFVTLTKAGELRGCIGYIHGIHNLVQSITEMAQAAAFKDPRFPTVKQNEMSEIEIEISVLSELTIVEDISEIQIGRDGLMLNHPFGSGLLLPQVPVEWNWDLKTYLEQICYKAGLKAGTWKDEQARLYRFTAEIFHEGE